MHNVGSTPTIQSERDAATVRPQNRVSPRPSRNLDKDCIGVEMDLDAGSVVIRLQFLRSLYTGVGNPVVISERKSERRTEHNLRWMGQNR